MAISLPAQTTKPGSFGVRKEPAPGDYIARLENIRYDEYAKAPLQLDWVLTNHPVSCYIWVVTRSYSGNSIAFLSKDTWWWKRRKWGQLGETLEERLSKMRTWIGDEANVRIANWSSENPSLVGITAVWSLETPWPPPWTEEEVEEEVEED